MMGAMNNIEWMMNTKHRGWPVNTYDGIETMTQWEIWAEEIDRMLRTII